MSSIISISKNLECIYSVAYHRSVKVEHLTKPRVCVRESSQWNTVRARLQAVANEIVGIPMNFLGLPRTS